MWRLCRSVLSAFPVIWSRRYIADGDGEWKRRGCRENKRIEVRIRKRGVLQTSMGTSSPFRKLLGHQVTFSLSPSRLSPFFFYQSLSLPLFFYLSFSPIMLHNPQRTWRFWQGSMSNMKHVAEVILTSGWGLMLVRLCSWRVLYILI